MVDIPEASLCPSPPLSLVLPQCQLSLVHSGVLSHIPMSLVKAKLGP